MKENSDIQFFIAYYSSFINGVVERDQIIKIQTLYPWSIIYNMATYISRAVCQFYASLFREVSELDYSKEIITKVFLIFILLSLFLCFCGGDLDLRHLGTPFSICNITSLILQRVTEAGSVK